MIASYMTRRLLLTVSLLVLVLAGLFVWQRQAAVASPLDQQVLASKGLDIAQKYGLQGNPTSQKTAQMTLGEWLNLNNAELGKDAAQFGLSSDTPVFVLVMRGHVDWRGPGIASWVGGQKKYDSITVVVDARTGDRLWVRAGYPNSPDLVPPP